MNEPQVQDIERFDRVTENHIDKLRSHPEGVYVTYVDHQQIVTQKDERIAGLENEVLAERATAHALGKKWKAAEQQLADERRDFEDKLNAAAESGCDECEARREEAEQQLAGQEEALVTWIDKQLAAVDCSQKGAEQAGDEKAAAAYREAAYAYESVKRRIAFTTTQKETEGETANGD